MEKTAAYRNDVPPGPVWQEGDNSPENSWNRSARAVCRCSLPRFGHYFRIALGEIKAHIS